jgi:hypothetical protein
MMILEQRDLTINRNRYIIGKVRNTTNHVIRHARITFLLKNEAGNQVGIASSTVNNLQPHAIWEFEASIPNEDATSYTLLELTGQ